MEFRRVLFRSRLQKTEVFRGMILSKPSKIKAYEKFETEVYILKKEEVGRHTPFFVGYRPQFFVRTLDITGKVIKKESESKEKIEMVLPGDKVNIEVELIHSVAIEEGMRFAIREGGKTVGAGIITKLIRSEEHTSELQSLMRISYAVL